jgi:hypothetical protein
MRYIKLFAEASQKIIGEATTVYLYSYKTVIPNLKKIYGSKSKDIKIVILLRNPAESILAL